jgi:hypothetical protein
MLPPDPALLLPPVARLCCVAAAVADRVAANHSFERRQGLLPRPAVRTPERHREESPKLGPSQCAYALDQ